MDLGSPSVILVRPRNPANLGAVAQAMLNFGLSELRLVDPQCSYMGEEALERARGAVQVLRCAKVYESLEAAKKGLTTVVAATAHTTNNTGRTFGFGGNANNDFGEGAATTALDADEPTIDDEPVDEAAALEYVLGLPSYSPHSCATTMKDVAARNQRTAFLLGPESTGLTIADLQHADGLVHIPAHPAFSSLGIASALTVLAYESWTARNGTLPFRP